MAIEIKLPEVSESVESGDVVKVLVNVGDVIEADQPIIELETDKAMFEVPASEGGKVTEIKVKEGDKIKIGDVILTLDGAAAGKDTHPAGLEEKEKEEEEEEKEEEQPEAEEKDAGPKEEKPMEKEAVQEEKAEEPVKEDTHPAPVQKVSREERNGTPARSGAPAPAAPSVRRLARELGVDINEVPGSGPGGRISDEDVKQYVKSIMTQGAPAIAQVPAGGGGALPFKPLPDFTKWGATETEPMNRVRQVTAENMSYAWSTVPQVTQFDEADITELEAFRKKNAPAVKEKGGQLTITAILLKACEAALRTFPQFNASIDMQKKEVVYKKYYNIGIAADTDRGLLVPVVKDVDKKNLTELSLELAELSAKARDRKLTPEEMDGGNFTISNLGGIGGTAFTPIVYAPQVAILGVSRASYKPVYRSAQAGKDGGFEPRLVLPLTLTYDHRIIDGADAARFLRWLCNALENPFNMLL